METTISEAQEVEDLGARFKPNKIVDELFRFISPIKPTVMFGIQTWVETALDISKTYYMSESAYNELVENHEASSRYGKNKKGIFVHRTGYTFQVVKTTKYNFSETK